jgi:DNA-binding MarR family transcriptional regulator
VCLAKRFHVSADKLTPSIEALLQKELVTTTSQVDGQGDEQLQLTPAGQETVDKLEIAYRDSLTELLDGWSPEQEAELATLLHRVTTNLLSEKSTTALISTPA